MEAIGIPLLNTIILVTSGGTLTLAHHALKAGHRGALKFWLAVTIALGFSFLGLQAYEYTHAYSALNLKLSSGVYGSTFFMLTGFHGLHVTIGAIMLLVIWLRVLRGHFTPGVSGLEWCERRLLARIHRYTLDRLRKEIEPVAAADFMRFLFRWHRVAPDARAQGPEGLAAVLELLDGYEIAAGAWETDVLPARLEDYDPLWLDGLCLSGEIAWGRLSPAGASGVTATASRPWCSIRRSARKRGRRGPRGRASSSRSSRR